MAGLLWGERDEEEELPEEDPEGERRLQVIPENDRRETKGNCLCYELTNTNNS